MIGQIVLIVTLSIGQQNSQPVRQLEDPDPSVRMKAAKLLKDKGPLARDALKALRRTSVDDADEDVRLIASQAVKRIEEAINQNKKNGKRDPPINQPPTPSILGQSPPKATAANRWIGKRAVQRYPELRLLRADQAHQSNYYQCIRS